MDKKFSMEANNFEKKLKKVKAKNNLLLYLTQVNLISLEYLLEYILI